MSDITNHKATTGIYETTENQSKRLRVRIDEISPIPLKKPS